MQPDYPAAHSMDATWYAVDKHGHVGVFDTGAGGAVPANVYSPTLAEDMADLDPEDLEEMGVDPASVREIAQHLPDHERLFAYGTGDLDECLADRYQRQHVPKRPLHIDELPPDARKAIGEMRFETIDFREAETIQPIELTQCGTWDPAYLSGDGTTVKAVPGREKDYADYIKESRDLFAEDGLTVEEPPVKKRATPRKKKGRGDGK
jgi:hypothetical protein